MKKLWLFTAFAAAAAASVVGSSSCSGSGAKDLCQDNKVTCQLPFSCDPEDGVCKCGGRGGVICPAGFECDVNSNTCVSHRCDSVTCANQTACDVNDGKCKCGGTGGTVCADTDSCDPVAKQCISPLDCRQVACPANQTCDPTNGHCSCGGNDCGADKYCSVASGGAKACIDSLCAGVHCIGSTVCDPNDGVCKCNGGVCSVGQACQCPSGSDPTSCTATQRTCRTSSACSGVACDGGTSCDPTDGQCRCGGPGGPACGTSQTCYLGPPLQCQGGNQCTLADGGSKQCGGATSCDPEDGLCKCGGRGGQICAAPNPPSDPVGETCVATPSLNACRRPCNPSSPDCPTGEYCFFDSSATTPVAYCSGAPADAKSEGQQCSTPTACFSATPTPHSLHCLGLQQGSVGVCRSYCDVNAGSASCAQVPVPQTCQALSGAPSGTGFCKP